MTRSGDDLDAELDAVLEQMRVRLAVASAVDAALRLVQDYRGGDIETEYLAGARHYGREVGERIWQKFMDESAPVRTQTTTSN